VHGRSTKGAREIQEGEVQEDTEDSKDEERRVQGGRHKEGLFVKISRDIIGMGCMPNI
jgi:hypothetical protein